jgi:hypothetical protein
VTYSEPVVLQEAGVRSSVTDGERRLCGHTDGTAFPGSSNSINDGYPGRISSTNLESPDFAAMASARNFPYDMVAETTIGALRARGMKRAIPNAVPIWF